MRSLCVLSFERETNQMHVNAAAMECVSGLCATHSGDLT